MLSSSPPTYSTYLSVFTLDEMGISTRMKEQLLQHVTPSSYNGYNLLILVLYPTAYSNR